ncbi:MAG: RNase adapter RapZ [Lachnospiraceae bacterium]|nr:RNase adapter RapZ [Lachnospiraceae bacterium]
MSKRFVIVTGMSGAGKSTVLKFLEDARYFCVDNLPVPLIIKFAELSLDGIGDSRNIALGIDIRSGQALDELSDVLDKMKDKFRYEILFLDANDETLVKRFKETRRAHPLALTGRVDEGIDLERKKMQFLRERADYIVDTSHMLTRELKQQMERIVIHSEEFKNLYITILSFGFKYGIPTDADLVFDVRFMPNPYYVEELKYKTGNDKEVQDYVMQSEVSGKFLNKLVDMLEFLIPNYIKEGKTQLVIAVGCTGGKHRSVTIANELFSRLSENNDVGVNISHRDIKR